MMYVLTRETSFIYTHIYILKYAGINAVLDCLALWNIWSALPVSKEQVDEVLTDELRDVTRWLSGVNENIEKQ